MYKSFSISDVTQSYIQTYRNQKKFLNIDFYLPKTKTFFCVQLYRLNNDGKKFDTSILVYFSPNTKFFMSQNCHGINMSIRKKYIANLVDFEHILALQRMSILSVTFFSYNFMCSLHVKVFMTINMKKLKFQRLCNAAYGTKHTVFYYH